MKRLARFINNLLLMCHPEPPRVTRGGLRISLTKRSRNKFGMTALDVMAYLRTMPLLSVLMACHFLLYLPVLAQQHVGITYLEQKALKDAVFTGPTYLSNVTADSLVVTGPFEFHNLTVTNDATIQGPIANSEEGNFGRLEVTGPLMATNIHCKVLAVIGPAHVSKIQVRDNTSILGPLVAKESTFQDLSGLGDRIVLENVEVRNIFIQKNSKKDEPQILDLLDKTLVKGNISFESGKGIVNRAPFARVTGKIRGAITNNIK